MDREKRMEIRTDLALEEKESIHAEGMEVGGVSLREWKEGQGAFRITEVVVQNESGARAMGKPVGRYLTLEAEGLRWAEESYLQDFAMELARQLRRMSQRFALAPEGNILVVGLGNEAVTPDALGARVVSHLKISRHLRKEEREELFGQARSISALVPGVMAQTGMETAEILRGVVKESKPSLVLVVDALAARSVSRLGNTIQLSDTGISPGSGVGNHRSEISEKTLGVPVLALGVPTVVGAAAIAQDTFHALLQVLAKEERLQEYAAYMERMQAEEQYALIRELLEPEFGSLYVTEPDIDETVRKLGLLLAEGIHQAFYASL